MINGKTVMLHPTRDLKTPAIGTAAGEGWQARIRAAGRSARAHLPLALSARGLLLGGWVADHVQADAGVALLVGGGLLGTGLAAVAAARAQRGGARVLTWLFLLEQLLWSGLLLVMFGRGMQNFLSATGLVSGNLLVRSTILAATAVTYAAVVRTHCRRWAAWAAPCVATIGGIVMLCVLYDVPWGDLANIPPLIPREAGAMHVFRAGACVLGVALLCRPSVPSDVTGTRESGWAGCLTRALGTAAMGIAGLSGALLLRSYDPTQWLIFLGGRALGAAILMVLMLSALGTVGAMMRAALTRTREFPALMKVNPRRRAAVVFAPLAVFAAYPNAIYERGEAVFAVAGCLLTPLYAGIIVCRSFRKSF